MNCIHCNDTGSLSRSLDGDLDCGHCDVAQERARVSSWAAGIRRQCDTGTLAWLAYLRGKAASATDKTASPA